MFGFGKKKEKESCCCSANSAQTKETNSGQGIKVLGMGCGRCNELARNVEMAMKELGIAGEVEHVTEMSQIASYGVISTPALVLNGKVVSAGKTLSTEEVISIIKAKNISPIPAKEGECSACG